MRALLAIAALLLTGCTAIHSYNATRDFNPKAINISGNLGSGVAVRDRDGDGKLDKLKIEKVLVPDAKANIRIHASDVVAVGIDPLPPSVGVNLLWRYFPVEDRSTSVNFEPTFNYLVWPLQKIYSVELPLAVAHRLRKWLTLYGGPKVIYQSGALQPDKRFPQAIWMTGVPDRPDQDFRFVGAFAGFAVGWLHFQMSPEVDYYYDVRTGEQVMLFGVGVRLAL